MYAEQNDDFDFDEFVAEMESDGDVQMKLHMFSDLFDSYQNYFDKTLNGEYGNTPKFVCTYIYLVDLLYFYDRAIRTNDLELYKFASFEMNSLFFVFNHQNYARWLCRFNDNLQNIDTTHPGMMDQLTNGAFTIRRTNKIFSRAPIDLTLEQTINANAGNRLRGITAFTNNIDARQKWATTHSIRTYLVHQFYEFIGIVKLDDLSESINENKKFAEKVEKYMCAVGQSLNPFDENLNKCRSFNISTGKAASDETSGFLLNVLSIGKSGLRSFIEECKSSSKRFDEPIRRNKVFTFASEIFKPKKSAKNNEKISEIKLEKEVIWQILCMALQREMNLEAVLSYPLTNVPHMLAHADGTIYLLKNNNELHSILLKNSIDLTCSIPLNYDVEIINGDEFLYGIKDAPKQYGEIATFLLKNICNTTASEVHIIFSRHTLESISIINYEMNVRTRLYDDSSTYKINGPHQERTIAWSKCVLSQNYRNELIEFCMNSWRDDDCGVAEIIKEKRLFVSHGQECFLFCKSHEQKKRIPSLKNNHAIFDFKTMLHISKTCGNCRIIIKSQNTDSLLILLLYHMQFMDERKKIWIYSNSSTKNQSIHINVREIFSKIDSSII